jgi:hypothetical protein
VQSVHDVSAVANTGDCRLNSGTKRRSGKILLRQEYGLPQSFPLYGESLEALFQDLNPLVAGMLPTLSQVRVLFNLRYRS